MDTSKAVERVYSLTSSPRTPTTNILSPLSLNATSRAPSSWELISKLSTKDAVDTSKAVERVYSSTSSPFDPTTNIFVPSLLNLNPWGVNSWSLIENPSTYVAALTALALSPSLTVSVASSFTVPVSSLATGASLEPLTVIVNVAVVVAPFSSVTV